MIIHNTNPGPQARQVSNDVPNAVSNTPRSLTATTATSAAPSQPSAVPSQPSAVPSQPSAEQLKNAVDVINQVLQQSNHSIEFSVDSDTQTPIVKLVDTETGELLRQYPSEQTLAISQAIGDFQQGLLLTQKA